LSPGGCLQFTLGCKAVVSPICEVERGAACIVGGSVVASLCVGILAHLLSLRLRFSKSLSGSRGAARNFYLGVLGC
jgi:hypothetical protein